MNKDKRHGSKPSYSDGNFDDQPLSYEEACNHLQPTPNLLQPTVLVLGNTFKSIHPENDPTTPLYRMSRNVLAIPQESSSVVFERVERKYGYADGCGNRRPEPEKHSDAKSKDKGRVESGEQNQSQSQQLFYIVHPDNARYRKDIPAQYYVTAMNGDLTLGNIRLATAKNVLGKVEFTAVVSKGRTMYDGELFDEKAEHLLFCAKSKWRSGRLKWADAAGNEVAVGEGNGKESKLVITKEIEREFRDALVAVWVLGLWHDTMESPEGKRECRFDMIPTVNAVRPCLTNLPYFQLWIV